MLKVFQTCFQKDKIFGEEAIKISFLHVTYASKHIKHNFYDRPWVSNYDVNR